MEMLGRRALWEIGLNYGHGTGHGVGNYFGVHECKTSQTYLSVMSSLALTIETSCRDHCTLYLFIDCTDRACGFSDQ